ncbi:hypothetical protein MPDQ_001752 [Monascus purpureus]|uniref:Uncharacterized protein n=1 Tax=Monascus purpureus TaxID=5098 RepID=A0A507R0A9_MONPU|nr:hypothetical protein MPDQ_001752 [Monascus purpureus]BDD59670.1 hypothetical protein MAP00_004865 [Monascus purpureus]
MFGLKVPKVYNVYFVALIAAVGGMLISSMSAAARTEQHPTYFDNPVDTCQGTIGSALAASSVIGSFASGSPVYLAEISKHDKRGSIMLTQQIAIDIGFTIYFLCLREKRTAELQGRGGKLTTQSDPYSLAIEPQ